MHGAQGEMKEISRLHGRESTRLGTGTRSSIPPRSIAISIRISARRNKAEGTAVQ